MTRMSARRAGGSRITALGLCLIVLGSLLAACSSSGPAPAASRTGNARVNAGVPDDGSGPTTTTSNQAAPGVSDTTLSSTELGIVYQYILQGYVDPVDHARLLESAIAGVRETAVKSGALPLDLAAVDLLPAPTDSPERDWQAFARGYDALVGKHPGWAEKARPDRVVLRQMLAALKDDHALFIDPDEVRRMSETGFSGVGIRLGRPKPEDLPYVVEVYRDSPAVGAGLKPGDQIAAVDGVSTAGRSLTEIVTGIRGRQGTAVVLSIVRGTDPPTDVRVTRGAVQTPPVEAAIRGGVLGVLRIRSFAEGVPEQVQNLLTQGRNRGVRAWIIDLRGNPGGSIEAMARVAANFVEARPVGLAIDRAGQREPIAVPTRPAIPRFPFVVLIDRETASGAEVLAAAIKDYQIAPLVGTRTAGSTGIAIPQALSDGSAVQITVRRLLSPAGTVIDKQGVQPDYEAELTVADLQRGDDPQFVRAVELLAGGPAPVLK